MTTSTTDQQQKRQHQTNNKKICPFCKDDVAMEKIDRMCTPGLQDVYRCPNCFYFAGFMYVLNEGPKE
jgi:hypothetical protein